MRPALAFLAAALALVVLLATKARPSAWSFGTLRGTVERRPDDVKEIKRAEELSVGTMKGDAPEGKDSLGKKAVDEVVEGSVERSEETEQQRDVKALKAKIAALERERGELLRFIGELKDRLNAQVAPAQVELPKKQKGDPKMIEVKGILDAQLKEEAKDEATMIKRKIRDMTERIREIESETIDVKSRIAQIEEDENGDDAQL